MVHVRGRGAVEGGSGPRAGVGNRQEGSDEVVAGCPPPRGCPDPFHRDPDDGKSPRPSSRVFPTFVPRDKPEGCVSLFPCFTLKASDAGLDGGGPLGELVLVSPPSPSATRVGWTWARGQLDPAACPRRAGASGKQEGSLGARIPWDGGPPVPGTVASRARPREHEGVLQTRNRSPHRLLSGKPERGARLLISSLTEALGWSPFYR